MAEKSIVTQTQLGDLKSALKQEADSLLFHSGDSMSAAHGFNIMNGPINDGSGNDLRYYQDSNGDVVGTAMLHVVILGVDYYAPVMPTVLAGQDPEAGIVPDISALLQPGGNSWVTDYATEATGDANLVMTGLLLPHTQRYFAETHSSVTAQVLVTLDSAGHTVGTHVLVLYFGQKKLFVPATTRLGGPPQPARLPTYGISVSETADLNHTSMGRDDNQYGNMWYRNPVGGTLPISFTWQVNQKTNGTGAWNDLTPPSGSLPTDYGGSYTMIGNRIQFQVSSGSDSSRLVLVVRGKYTNAAGSVYSNLCHFRANDEDGCGFISGPDTNQDVYNESIPQCITLNHCKPAP